MILLPVDLHDRLLAAVLERYPQKSFGYLVSNTASYRPSDFIMFGGNIRNDDAWHGEFVARGRYFADHADAGFVATPAESWRVQRHLLRTGLSEVAVFHTHKRHPGNFSGIDYDLHISRFTSLWHLIISLRTVQLPQLRAYAVTRAGVRELNLRLITHGRRTAELGP